MELSPRVVKKQTCVPPSFMKFEYVVNCVAVVQEVMRLKRFLERLGINSVNIHCDSELAIAYIVNPKDHEKTKFIGIKYHFIRDVISQK